jgi:exopolysaccharide biosynthesis polyprenyl glycosylphosphotransferase
LKTRKKSRAGLKWQILILCLDLLAINAAIVLSFLIRFLGRLPEYNFQAYLDLAAYITIIFAAIYYIHDLYDVDRHFDWSGTAARIVQANLLAIVTVLAFSFAFRAFSFPRLVFVISYFVITLLVLSGRLIVTRFFALELPKERVLVASTPEFARKLADEVVERERLGLILAGHLEISSEEASSENTAREIVKRAVDAGADRIILASESSLPELIFRITEHMPKGIRLQVVPGVYEALFGRINFETLADIPLVDVVMPPDTAWAKFGKRVVDLVFSFSSLVLLSPILLIVAVLIKLTSKGPVFYLQRRVGLNGSEFNCIKFRTMVKDAELYSGPVLAEENDPRITPVGRFLRKYRIDEIPQLINILRGEMSLVGPRPERPEFVKVYEREIPLYKYRHLVRPGITGLAQIYGKYDTDPVNKLKYDLIYVLNLSFNLDMFILLRTVNVVLTGKGAR